MADTIPDKTQKAVLADPAVQKSLAALKGIVKAEPDFCDGAIMHEPADFKAKISSVLDAMSHSLKQHGIADAPDGAKFWSGNDLGPKAIPNQAALKFEMQAVQSAGMVDASRMPKPGNLPAKSAAECEAWRDL